MTRWWCSLFLLGLLLPVQAMASPALVLPAPTQQDTGEPGVMHLERGKALAGQGLHEEALREFNAAAGLFEASGDERYLAMLLQERAQAREALGELERALADQKRFLAVQQRLLDSVAAQRSVAMRQQFDAARRELETQRLTQETAVRREELDALLKVRRWQLVALALGAAILLVMVGLVIRQVLHSRRFRALAELDELTGLANRRSIERSGARAVAQARAGNHPLSVLALDIDHFKQVNDSHGHHAGDRVLARVAQACQAALRQGDRLGRVGGEEFLAILPGIAPEAAAGVAERLRGSVEALDFSDIDPALKATISLGVAGLRPEDADLAALVHRADLALYRAKAGGRNRVEVRVDGTR